jgi:hypothetical protein
LKAFKVKHGHAENGYLGWNFEFSSANHFTNLVLNKMSGKLISDIIFCVEGITLRGSDPYL